MCLSQYISSLSLYTLHMSFISFVYRDHFYIVHFDIYFILYFILYALYLFWSPPATTFSCPISKFSSPPNQFSATPYRFPTFYFISLIRISLYRFLPAPHHQSFYHILPVSTNIHLTSQSAYYYFIYITIFIYHHFLLILLLSLFKPVHLHTYPCPTMHYSLPFIHLHTHVSQ